MSYVRFLNKHGGKELAQYAAVKELCTRNALGKAAAPLASLQGTPMASLATTVPCDFLHAGQTCGQHARRFFPQAYMRALPVYVPCNGCVCMSVMPPCRYLPVYVIPALLVHRRALLQPPGCWDTWRKIGMGVLRSSAFLALYCTLAWRGMLPAHERMLHVSCCLDDVSWCHSASGQQPATTRCLCGVSVVGASHRTRHVRHLLGSRPRNARGEEIQAHGTGALLPLQGTRFWSTLPPFFSMHPQAGIPQHVHSGSDTLMQQPETPPLSRSSRLRSLPWPLAGSVPPRCLGAWTCCSSAQAWRPSCTRTATATGAGGSVFAASTSTCSTLSLATRVRDAALGALAHGTRHVLLRAGAGADHAQPEHQSAAHPHGLFPLAAKAVVPGAHAFSRPAEGFRLEQHRGCFSPQRAGQPQPRGGHWARTWAARWATRWATRGPVGSGGAKWNVFRMVGRGACWWRGGRGAGSAE